MFKCKSIISCFLFLLISFCTNDLFCKLKNNKLHLGNTVKIAYKNRLDLESFNFVIRANWYSERAIIGKFLPQISMFADSGRSSEPTTTGSGISPYPRESIGFELSQLIFSYDGPLVEYKIAQEETNISRAQKDQLQNVIRISTENSFLNTKKILLKKELITTLNESSQETFDQNKSRQKVGFLNKTGWDSAKFQYSQGQTEVKNYPSDVDIALSILKRETNANIETDSISLDYKDISKIQLNPVDYYYKQAMLYRPDLTEKKYRINQADYSERFYRYRYIPEIYFGAIMQKNRLLDCVNKEIYEILPEFDNEPLYWHVGLRVVWNFDGLSSFNTSKKFDNTSTSILLQKRDLELNILKDIQVAHSNLKNLLDFLDPAEKKYQTAKTQKENLKKQYDVGLAPSFAYKKALFDYKQAEFDLISLKIEVRNSYQGLLFVCGYPPEISS